MRKAFFYIILSFFFLSNIVADSVTYNKHPCFSINSTANEIQEMIRDFLLMNPVDFDTETIKPREAVFVEGRVIKVFDSLWVDSDAFGIVTVSITGEYQSNNILDYILVRQRIRDVAIEYKVTVTVNYYSFTDDYLLVEDFTESIAETLIAFLEKNDVEFAYMGMK